MVSHFLCPWNRLPLCWEPKGIRRSLCWAWSRPKYRFTCFIYTYRRYILFFFLFHLASLFPVLIKQCGIYSAQCLRFLHVILMMFVSPRYDLYSGLVIKCQITNQPFYFAEVSHHPGADPVPSNVWCLVLPIRMCTACWSSTPPWCWPSTQ